LSLTNVRISACGTGETPTRSGSLSSVVAASSPPPSSSSPQAARPSTMASTSSVAASSQSRLRMGAAGAERIGSGTGPSGVFRWFVGSGDGDGRKRAAVSRPWAKHLGVGEAASDALTGELQQLHEHHQDDDHGDRDLDLVALVAVANGDVAEAPA